MVFRVGDPAIRVRWVFSKEGALRFPEWHAFPSANWDERFCVPGPLGEQPGVRPWRNGSGVVAPGTSLGDCGNQGWFLTGIPDGQEAPPLGPDGIPVCCSETPFDCFALPDTLTLTFQGIDECSNIDGSITVTRTPDTCTYTGVKDTWLGAAGVTIDLAADPPTLTIDCFTGNPTLVSVEVSHSPFEVEWTFSDTAACCGFGESTFTATLEE